VIRLLDISLISMLRADLDLAAWSIPKIHQHMNEEDATNISILMNCLQKNSIRDQYVGGSRDKQCASGSSSTAPASRNTRVESSSRKHERDCGEPSGSGQGGGPNKRSRRGLDGNSSNDPDEGSNRDPDEGPSGHPDESVKNGEVDDSYGNPDRKPGEPGGDPGDDPSGVEAPGNPLNFACPFYKFDPRKFGPWTDDKYGKCPGSRIKKLRHIK
jgi:hypothetical protein